MLSSVLLSLLGVSGRAYITLMMIIPHCVAWRGVALHGIALCVMVYGVLVIFYLWLPFRAVLLPYDHQAKAFVTFMIA